MKGMERVKRVGWMPSWEGGEVTAPSPWGSKGRDEHRQRTPDEVVDEAFEEYSNNFSSPEDKARIRATVESVLLDAPDNPKAHVLLGYLDMDNKNLDGMYGHFLAALDLSPDPRTEYTWDYVIMCLDDGLRDYARLADYLTRFYVKRPETFVVDYLAKTYLKLNQSQKALMAASKHLGYFPDDKKIRKLREKIEKSMR